MILFSPTAKLLIRGADPERDGRRRMPLPARLIRMDALFEQAEHHGVLGALLGHLSTCAEVPSVAAAYAAAKGRDRRNVIFSRLLQMEAEALVASASGLPIAVVKGPVFARKIYPRSDLRSYSDIDILAAESAVPQLSQILLDNGFFLVDSLPGSASREWKWISRSNNAVMVEVQTNLIHTDSMVNHISLGYDLIGASPEGAAELLLVALVHGASHHYDRLQLVVDICQAARNLTETADEVRLEELVRATGSRLAAVTGLRLAGRVLREHRCLELARALGGTAYAPLMDMLLTDTVVLSSTTDRRTLHSWRRSLFRWLVKKDLA